MQGIPQFYILCCPRELTLSEGWGECTQTHTVDELCTFPLQEPMDVVELFGLSGIQHTPISIKNARVSQVRDLSQILGELLPGIAFNRGRLSPTSVPDYPSLWSGD